MDFSALTRVPIIVLYGDDIPAPPPRMPAQDGWRVRLAIARLWRDTVNKHGGGVALVHLPEIDIRGHTRFPFSDLNDLWREDPMSKFLADNGVDGGRETMEQRRLGNSGLDVSVLGYGCIGLDAN